MHTDGWNGTAGLINSTWTKNGKQVLSQRKYTPRTGYYYYYYYYYYYIFASYPYILIYPTQNFINNLPTHHCTQTKTGDKSYNFSLRVFDRIYSGIFNKSKLSHYDQDDRTLHYSSTTQPIDDSQLSIWTAWAFRFP